MGDIRERQVQEFRYLESINPNVKVLIGKEEMINFIKETC
jgi:hypothetical protein